MIIFSKCILPNTKFIISNLKNVYYITNRSNFSGIRSKFGFLDPKKRNVKLKIRDKISDEYELIYRTNFDNYVYSSRAFGILSTLIITPLMFYVDYYSPAGITKIPIKPEVEGFLQSGDMDIFIYATALMAFNLMIMITSGRFPLRIYRHTQKDSYIALLPTYVPYKPKQVHFRAGDVTPVPESMKSMGILPWASARHVLGQQKIFLFEHCFRTSEEYYTIIKSE